MAYTRRDDWSGDRFSGDPDPHYRILLGRHGRPVVACLQDFDYFDYDARLVLSAVGWTSNAEAEAALLALVPAIEAAERCVSTTLPPDMRRRLIASIVRGDAAAQDCPDGAGCERHPLGHRRGDRARFGGPADVADLARPGIDLTYLPLTDEHLAALTNGERVVVVVPADDPADELTVVLRHVPGGFSAHPFRTGDR